MVTVSDPNILSWNKGFPKNRLLSHNVISADYAKRMNDWLICYQNVLFHLLVNFVYLLYKNSIWTFSFLSLIIVVLSFQVFLIYSLSKGIFSLLCKIYFIYLNYTYKD